MDCLRVVLQLASGRRLAHVRHKLLFEEAAQATHELGWLIQRRRRSFRRRARLDQDSLGVDIVPLRQDHVSWCALCHSRLHALCTGWLDDVRLLEAFVLYSTFIVIHACALNLS